ncbi:hypothetical protein [Dyadobacter aurulentus]|uniref:hypothetical protein n=1 Tax=Dyadobacter sp. UC 10 TaxID=2605428 RepID=UPI0011F37D14|nr:hypothetical protein [Dyadobacter sp. UC 10]KAA0993390.1 hypothetical protein FXO21_26035 [Dyadobacter sp. UC 10]
MEQEYVLDWFDQMVSNLDPENTDVAKLDLHQSQFIIEKAADEKKRLTSYLKLFRFQGNKKRHVRSVVNQYLKAILVLTQCAASRVKRVPDESPHFKSALECVLSSLMGLCTFMIDRYWSDIDPDIGLEAHYLSTRMPELYKLEDCLILRDDPLLSSVLIKEFNAIFYNKTRPEITLRSVSYWKSITELLGKCQNGDDRESGFSKLEVMLIERNFNSPNFVTYLESKFICQLKQADSQSEKLHQLAFLQKSFNQIPFFKEAIYDLRYDDLRLTVNNWFIYEIEYQSKNTVFNKRVDTSNSNKLSRKTSDKILCNLTVDQLALLFKAADQSQIIVSRSLSAIFETVAPYLATRHRVDISSNSLRVKSYTVEDRDKQLLLTYINRLRQHIEEL